MKKVLIVACTVFVFGLIRQVNGADTGSCSASSSFYLERLFDEKIKYAMLPSRNSTGPLVQDYVLVEGDWVGTEKEPGKFSSPEEILKTIQRIQEKYMVTKQEGKIPEILDKYKEICEYVSNGDSTYNKEYIYGSYEHIKVLNNRIDAELNNLCIGIQKNLVWKKGECFVDVKTLDRMGLYFGGFCYYPDHQYSFGLNGSRTCCCNLITLVAKGEMLKPEVIERLKCMSGLGGPEEEAFIHKAEMASCSYELVTVLGVINAWWTRFADHDLNKLMWIHGNIPYDQ
jgi:hypothetical protein